MLRMDDDDNDEMGDGIVVVGGGDEDGKMMMTIMTPKIIELSLFLSYRVRLCLW